MNTWNQIPFIRLLLPFISGILVSIFYEFQSPLLLYVIFSLLIFISLFVLIKPLNFSFAYSWIFGLLINGILFLIGLQLTSIHTEKYRNNHFSNYLNGAELYYIKANEPSLEKEKSYKISVTVLAVKQNQHWVKTTGKAMCYFKKDSISKQLNYGDCLLTKTTFTEIKPPQNPGEFNYKQFLSFHNIDYQAYMTSNYWKPLNQNEGNPVIQAAYNLRESLLNIYRKNNITGDEFAVGSALVLGYVDKLDQDIISTYASSGALHVLSVSGLHVGIIFLMVNFLLSFLDKNHLGKLLKVFLLLSILWFYATLTGLSPAVLRATAMFSFIVIAQAWKYNTNIFNTLFVSCFFLLLYNPYLITEVGFQLSFLAVLGIVAIHPWLSEKWQPANWLMNQAWQVTSISVAAQIATFPLGLLYFHQFPNYFLFSNLIVIPLSSVILIYGLFLFIAAQFSIAAAFFSKVFIALVGGLNKSVQFVENIPGALIQSISISTLETWTIYLLIFCILIYIYKKQVRYIITSFTIIVFLLSLQTIEAHSFRKQKAIIIYNVPKIAAYDFISGTNTVFIADSLLTSNPGKMLFHVRHNWWERGIRSQKIVKTDNKEKFSNTNLAIQNNYIQFGNKRIAIINSVPTTSVTPKVRMEVDIIILSKNPKIKVKDLNKWYSFKKIIIDSSNSGWGSKIWKKECEEMKTECYSVIESGAYVEEL